jgi:hypothetical protein
MMSKVSVVQHSQYSGFQERTHFATVRKLLLRWVTRFSFRSVGTNLIEIVNSLSGNIGLLLLCEVAVKPFYEQTQAVRVWFISENVLISWEQQYDADKYCKANNKMYYIPPRLTRFDMSYWLSFRATKGIGRMQPMKWKDAGKALSNEKLLGCHMPDGPGQDIPFPDAYLHYNEVSSAE